MSQVSAPPPFSVREKTERAKSLVELYADPHESSETVVVDLIADLLHFATSINVNIDFVLRKAEETYDEERHAMSSTEKLATHLKSIGVEAKLVGEASEWEYVEIPITSDHLQLHVQFDVEFGWNWVLARGGATEVVSGEWQNETEIPRISELTKMLTQALGYVA
ncbi:MULTISPECIES: hypothetical protein [Streptomyces]|uniref:Uncharacterized protein n=2 Tax=Streptomyces TaxID=1883 RepID=A0ABV9IXB0_9ACTN